jgi:hypothetical protein
MHLIKLCKAQYFASRCQTSIITEMFNKKKASINFILKHYEYAEQHLYNTFDSIYNVSDGCADVVKITGYLQASHIEQSKQTCVLDVNLGQGKTFASIAYIRNVLERNANANILVISHGRQLCKQQAQELGIANYNNTTYYPENCFQMVVCINSLEKIAEKYDLMYTRFDVILFDEASIAIACVNALNKKSKIVKYLQRIIASSKKAIIAQFKLDISKIKPLIDLSQTTIIRTDDTNQFAVYEYTDQNTFESKIFDALTKNEKCIIFTDTSESIKLETNIHVMMQKIAHD